MEVGRGENNAIHPFPSEHVDILFLKSDLVVGGAENDVVPHFPGRVFNSLGKLWIEGIDDRCDHKPQGLGPSDLQTPGGHVGLVVQLPGDGTDPVSGLSTDPGPVVQCP